MRTSDYDFELPEHLIAQHPAPKRQNARMLVVDRAAGTLEHRHFYELPSLLDAGDALVMNNTQVIPARTFGQKESGGSVEVLFVEPDDDSANEWWVMMKSSRRPKPGVRIVLCEDLTLEVLENRADGLNRVRAHCTRPFLDLLDEIGVPPLPPYISRQQEKKSEEDCGRYQTVFARHPGAVAAPTAGLHFTPEILDACNANGVNCCELTLHVGPGTFRPVKVEKLEDHRMDPERYELTAQTAEALLATQAQGGTITAVGSTSVRTLETIAARHGTLLPESGRSELFIHPPYAFTAVDQILTNFHLPRSTLLMMMSAFAGRELIMDAYREAIQHEYRFYSYGDCMLLR